MSTWLVVPLWVLGAATYGAIACIMYGFFMQVDGKAPFDGGHESRGNGRLAAVWPVVAAFAVMLNVFDCVFSQIARLWQRSSAQSLIMHLVNLGNGKGWSA